MAKVKLNFGKIIGLSILVIALAVAIALTQQNQNFREKAYLSKPSITPIPPVKKPTMTPSATYKGKVQPLGTPVRSY